MKMPNKSQIESARAKYPKGTRIELPNGAADKYSPLQAGVRGTVEDVDDMLNIMVKWDTGSTLNAIIGVDDIRIIKPIITDVIFEQIMEIRKQPNVPNMFSVNEVQRLAFDLGFYELVDFLETDRKTYCHFIITGERGDGECEM